MSNNASRYARHHAFEKRLGWVPLNLGPIASPAPVPAPAPGIPAPLDLAGRKPVAYVNGRYWYDEANVICAMPVGRSPAGRSPSGRGRVRYERWVMGTGAGAR